MSHDRTEVDVKDLVYEFDINRGYYDPIPFVAAVRLQGQTGQGLQHEAARTAASESDGTLLKWYVIRFSQPHTGTGREGSGADDCESSAASDDGALDSAKTREGQRSASKRRHEGNIRMWYVTMRTRFITAVGFQPGGTSSIGGAARVASVYNPVPEVIIEEGSSKKDRPRRTGKTPEAVQPAAPRVRNSSPKRGDKPDKWRFRVCPQSKKRCTNCPCTNCKGKSLCLHGRQRHKCKECQGKGVVNQSTGHLTIGRVKFLRSRQAEEQVPRMLRCQYWGVRNMRAS